MRDSSVCSCHKVSRTFWPGREVNKEGSLFAVREEKVGKEADATPEGKLQLVLQPLLHDISLYMASLVYVHFSLFNSSFGISLTIHFI